MLLGRDMSVIIPEMINAYIPLDADGSSTTRARVTQEFKVCSSLMLSLLLHFNLTTTLQQNFHTQQGKWLEIFKDPLPDSPGDEQIKANTLEISIDAVSQFFKSTEDVNARFRWFEVYAPNSEFYLKVAKPLLSLRTVGSIDVERSVKPLKNSILTKDRNRLGDSKAIVLMCTRENLKHIMNAKKTLGK